MMMMMMRRRRRRRRSIGQLVLYVLKSCMDQQILNAVYILNQQLQI
jgi:hypothetical protein